MLLVLALLVPVPGQSGGCPDVLIIGARGSGQSSYGEPVGAMVTAVAGHLSAAGRTVDAAALEYPAISVTDSFGLVLLNGDYDRSVADGVAELRRVLASQGERCRRTDIVLIGYSQGAQVIKEALAGSEPGYRIAGVVLLADPTRDPTQPGVRRFADPSASNAAGSFGAIALPGYARPITIDVCALGDAVCARGRFAFGAHVDGYTDIVGAVAARTAEIVEGSDFSFPGIR